LFTYACYDFPSETDRLRLQNSGAEARFFALFVGLSFVFLILAVGPAFWRWALDIQFLLVSVRAECSDARWSQDICQRESLRTSPQSQDPCFAPEPDPGLVPPSALSLQPMPPAVLPRVSVAVGDSIAKIDRDPTRCTLVGIRISCKQY
jgi:hypothetical protein